MVDRPRQRSVTRQPIAGPDWVADAVFYQVFPDRFASSSRVRKPGPLEPWETLPTHHGFKGGDLLGIVEHLDEIAGLGITALYLTPVFASASNHRYHAYDYERVDPMLGGDAALRELLDEAHRRGMRVILDGVFNHTGRGFWAFHHILENGTHSPYRDWFHLDAEVLDGRRPIVAYPAIRRRAAVTDAAEDPWPPDDESFGYRAWWNLPALPKLNHSNPEVREHIFGVAQHWLRFGIDGWRLDVPEEITEPGFWAEFRRRCLAVKPDAYLVGEIWRPAPEWLAGDRFHGLMNYPLAEAILSFTGGTHLDMGLVHTAHELGRYVSPIDAPEFARRLQAVMETYSPEVTARQLNLLDSHDTPRFVSMAGDDTAALRLATLVQMTLPGAPCIYYGDEVGLRGREDPDCRRGFPWDPAAQDRSLRDFIAGLIAVRRFEPLLRHGRFEVLAAENSAVAYRLFETADVAGGRAGRRSERSLLVALNAGDQSARLKAPLPGNVTAKQVSWPGCEPRSIVAPRHRAGALELDIQAREGTIIELVPA